MDKSNKTRWPSFKSVFTQSCTKKSRRPSPSVLLISSYLRPTQHFLKEASLRQWLNLAFLRVSWLAIWLRILTSTVRWETKSNHLSSCPQCSFSHLISLSKHQRRELIKPVIRMMIDLLTMSSCNLVMHSSPMWKMTAISTLISSIFSVMISSSSYFSILVSGYAKILRDTSRGRNKWYSWSCVSRICFNWSRQPQSSTSMMS